MNKTWSKNQLQPQSKMESKMEALAEKNLAELEGKRGELSSLQRSNFKEKHGEIISDQTLTIDDRKKKLRVFLGFVDRAYNRPGLFELDDLMGEFEFAYPSLIGEV